MLLEIVCMVGVTVQIYQNKSIALFKLIWIFLGRVTETGQTYLSEGIASSSAIFCVSSRANATVTSYVRWNPIISHIAAFLSFSQTHNTALGFMIIHTFYKIILIAVSSAGSLFRNMLHSHQWCRLQTPSSTFHRGSKISHTNVWRLQLPL